MNVIVDGRMLGAAVQRFTAKAECTSIYLLKAIEETVDSCRTMSDNLRVEMAEAERLRVRVESLPVGLGEIDPDDLGDAGIAKLLGSLRELHRVLIKKREAALRAPELVGAYREAVVEGYSEAINDAEHAFEAISDLRTAVREHDADFGVTTGPFTSVDDLMAALKA